MTYAKYDQLPISFSILCIMSQQKPIHTAKITNNKIHKSKLTTTKSK